MAHQASEKPDEQPKELSTPELVARRLRQLTVVHNFSAQDMNIVLGAATTVGNLNNALIIEKRKTEDLIEQIKKCDKKLADMGVKAADFDKRKSAALQLFAEMTKRQAQIEGVLNGK